MDLSHSLSIEKVVLSSIIFSPDEIYYVSGLLEVEDFYLPAHQEIYKIMLELHKENLPIDEDFIRRRANSKNINDSMLIERLSGMVGLGANGSSVPADLATQGYAAPQEVEKPKKNWFSDILGIGVRAVAAFFTGCTSEAVAMTAASVVPSLLDGDN